MAVVRVSRPWLSASRPLAAADRLYCHQPCRQVVAGFASAGRRIQERHHAAPLTAPRMNAAGCFLLRLLRLSPLEDAHFPVEIFLGVFLISVINARRSPTAPFMFSYNCLSFSNCPAVPRPRSISSATDRKRGRSQDRADSKARRRSAASRRVPLAAVETIRSDQPGSPVALVTDCANASRQLQQLPHAPLACVDALRGSSMFLSEASRDSRLWDL